jgi:hypothetical protein
MMTCAHRRWFVVLAGLAMALSLAVLAATQPLAAAPGQPDVRMSLAGQDADEDGIPDHLDPDDDNDGTTDQDEAAPDGAPPDRGDAPPDADGDGIADQMDPDDDNDGDTDADEAYQPPPPTAAPPPPAAPAERDREPEAESADGGTTQVAPPPQDDGVQIRALPVTGAGVPGAPDIWARPWMLVAMACGAVSTRWPLRGGTTR